MNPLTEQDIEEQLSYAYLHAIASRAGIGCEVAGRASDAHGIDARLTVWDDFPGSYFKEITISVQLKATVRQPTERNGFLSYAIQGIERYDALRVDRHAVPRILAVLFLPAERDQWITQTPEQLIMKRGAYWSSLVTAPNTTNDTGVTVYLPSDQIFSVEGIKSLAAQIALGNRPTYRGHAQHS